VKCTQNIKNAIMSADNFSFYFEFSSAFKNEFRSARRYVIFFLNFGRPIKMNLGRPTFCHFFLLLRRIIIFSDLLSFFYDFTSEFRNEFTPARRVVNFSDFWSVLKMNFSRPDVLSLFFEFSSAYKNEFRSARRYVIFF
jgi:hypothetical protein